MAIAFRPHSRDRLRQLAASNARALERTFEIYRPHLVTAIERRVGHRRATDLVAASREGLRELAPRVPLTRPGDSLRDNLYGAAAMLAVGRVLKAEGIGDEEVAAIAREAVVGRLNGYQGPLLRFAGRLRFTRHYQRLLARRARRSQRREYPGEWVFDRVPGDGQSFSWGIDYRRCPILELYRAEGYEELMPAACPLDFAISERMGDGLVRTTTLASGGDRCDFRYTGARVAASAARLASGAREAS